MTTVVGAFEPAPLSAPLPCIVCGVTLKSAVPPITPGEVTNQPHGGTAFCSAGHYGSTTFDPMDGSCLEITVCDSCLLAKRSVVRHTKETVRKVVTTVSQPWDPATQP